MKTESAVADGGAESAVADGDTESAVADGDVCVIIPAAGSGVRLGESLPKAFVDLAGRSILERCVAEVVGLRAHVVVVVPADLIAHARSLLPAGVSVVAGGTHRSDSVRAGLAAAGSAAIILVHDAARPLTPAAVFHRVINAIRAGHRAVVPAVAVVDTLKQVESVQGELVVTRTVDRESLQAVQTPQGFTREALTAAHADDAGLATDDAGLAERIGIAVHVVPGDPRAIKITTPWDLRVVREIVGSEVSSAEPQTSDVATASQSALTPGEAGRR